MISISLEEQVMQEVITQAKDLMSDWNSSRSMQKQFVIEYTKNNFSNATEAARKAGYAEGSAKQRATKLLNVRHIKDVLFDIQDTLEYRSLELSIASNIEIKQYLTAVMRGEVTEQILIQIGHGKQAITSIQSSTSDRIKAAELLGKSMKMWTERVEHENAVPVIISGEDELED